MAELTFQNKKVFYTLDGNQNNPPLVILNGIMMSHKSWEPFIPVLKNYFHIIRFDFLDQGLSEKMDEDYDQSLQVELLKALLDHLELSKIFLVGISYGGSIAMQFAAAYPAYLNRMALFNAAAHTNTWLRDVGRGWNEIAKTKNALAFYHATIPYIYAPTFYTNNMDWMDKRKDTLLQVFSNETFLNAMIRLTTSAEGHDVRDQLKDILVNTLVIAAEYDYLTPPYQQREIVSAMPKAEYLLLEDCGHASMYEKPRLFTSTIIGFFLESEKSYQI